MRGLSARPNASASADKSGAACPRPLSPAKGRELAAIGIPSLHPAACLQSGLLEVPQEAIGKAPTLGVTLLLTTP